MIGCVMGTGNVWRFPRIIAVTSSDTGSLTFLIAWACFLLTWSIPLIVTEYSIGRFTRSSPTIAFQRFMGDKFIWIGCWVSAVAFFIGAYFSVVVGWCLYYVYVACAWQELPATEPESRLIFENFTHTYWPLLNHTICLAICGLAIFKGAKGIEIANGLLVPMQAIIILIVFFWSLSRDYADIGIKFMFTPDWSTLLNPKLYVEAACQNGFDTAAGMGLLSAYAAYFSRNTGAVLYGVFLPSINNLVSIICGLTIFSTVFSTLIQTSPTLTIPQIVAIIKETGPGSTGLTFTWIPVLMSKLGLMGRILCGLFFICLSSGGLSSMISFLELTVRVIQDFGVRRRWAIIAALLLSFLVGVPSALSIDILSNQDFVWGFALILSGLCFCILVISYNPFKFRKVIVNDFGINDWNLPYFFVFIIGGLVPLEALGLIIWWAYTNIASTKWYELAAESLASTFLEWSILLVAVLAFNFVTYLLKCPIVKPSTKVGFDPHNLSEVPPAETYKLVREIPLSSQNALVIGDDLSTYTNKCFTPLDNLGLEKCK
ncbi:unnamed protein product [Hymenolepis diminuta]|uniref:Sodium-dependent transporter n=1 Tax=Hymenolepis diminuta TaxID=6216 RepID=A0A3P7BE16_HYMDI|nr:unnamed protein product [Hymenolepis diminuta]